MVHIGNGTSTVNECFMMSIEQSDADTRHNQVFAYMLEEH